MNQWLVVLSLVLTSFGVLRGEAPTAIVIKDAHIISVAGADLPKASVVLKDGLIQQVGANVNVPPDAWVIDGTGLTVYPGFIDALSTWGIPGADAPAGGAARTAGGSSASSPGAIPAPSQQRTRGPEDRPQTYSADRAADMVAPTDSRLEAARAAGFTSAATYPNRGIFMGQGALINLAGERGRDMVLVQPPRTRTRWRDLSMIILSKV